MNSEYTPELEHTVHYRYTVLKSSYLYRLETVSFPLQQQRKQCAKRGEPRQQIDGDYVARCVQQLISLPCVLAERKINCQLGVCAADETY